MAGNHVQAQVSAASCVLTSIVQDGGGYTVNFGDTLSEQFATFDDLVAWALSVADVPTTKKMCVAYAIARSADLSNLSSVLNRTFTLDLSKPNPVQVSA